MRKIKWLVFLLIFLCATTAFAAKVGYTNSKCYVYKKPSTSAAHVSVAKNTKLYYVGNTGKFYCVRIAGFNPKVFILKKYVSKSKSKTTSAPIPTPTPTPTPTIAPTSTPTSWKSKVEKIDWNKGGKLVKIKKIVTLYSVEKNLTLKVKRCGGTNHMDIEPYTESDTKQLWHIAEGYFSWKCHPMILMVGGRYIACSINTMPHGKGTIKNNDFEGHCCLHLINSKTHGTNKINQEHQKQIEKAYKWAHKGG